MDYKKQTIQQIVDDSVAQGVIDAIGDGISIQDTNLKILYQNKAHRDLFGDHVGNVCYRSYTCRSVNSEECPLERAFKDSKTYSEERQVHTETAALHVEITASPIKNNKGELIGGIEVVRDITNRRQDEERKQLVYEFTQKVGSRLDVDFRLHEICSLVVKLGYRMVWVGLLHKDTKEIIPKAQAGFEHGYLSSVKITYDDSPLGKGPTGRAVKSKHAIVQNYIRTDPQYKPWRENAVKRGYRSSAAFPIIEQDDVIGVLNVYNEHDEFPSQDIDFIQAFANLSASYIENAELVTNLQDLFIGMVNALAETIDAKSQWTRGHSDRVTDFAINIGKELGLDAKELKNLELASLLHDIGKIGTYESILNKPEKLSEGEFNLIKQHAGRGAEMLATIKQLKAIIPSIKYHHERYDGNGYPEGLQGEEIPIGARILCVADAVDSMLADRPYRKGTAMGNVISELNKGSDTQFDPKVVKAFLKTLKKSD